MAQITWESSLSRPQPRCARCEKAFGEGDEYVSFVNFLPVGIERRDECVACAESGGTVAFAHWRAKVARAGEKKKGALDLNFLVDFFRRLRDAGEDPARADITYIVALILMRKKILSQSRTEKDPQFLIVKFAGDPEAPLMRLPVPELTPERMTAIKDDLTRIFNLEEGADTAPPKSDPAVAN